MSPRRRLKDQDVVPVQQNHYANDDPTTSHLTITFFASDTEGIWSFAHQISGRAEPWFEPKKTYVLKSPLRIGTQWAEESETKDTKGTITESSRELYAIVGVETITVPAGNFADCVKVKTEYVAIEKSSSKKSAEGEGLYWYCRGVGLTKSWSRLAILEGDRRGAESERVIELVEVNAKRK